MAGAFLVSDFGLLVMMLRAFSRDLPCCSDRTDFLFLGSWEGPEAVLGCYGLDAERGLNLIRCWVVVGPMRSGGGSGAGRG